MTANIADRLLDAPRDGSRGVFGVLEPAHRPKTDQAVGQKDLLGVQNIRAPQLRDAAIQAQPLGPLQDHAAHSFTAELIQHHGKKLHISSEAAAHRHLAALSDALYRVASIEKLRVSERQDDEREIKKHLEQCRDLSLRLSAMKATIEV